MITIKLKDLPRYLEKSKFYKELEENDENTIEIKEKYIVNKDKFSSVKELKIFLPVINFCV